MPVERFNSFRAARTSQRGAIQCNLPMSITASCLHTFASSQHWLTMLREGQSWQVNPGQGRCSSFYPLVLAEKPQCPALLDSATDLKSSGAMQVSLPSREKGWVSVLKRLLWSLWSNSWWCLIPWFCDLISRESQLKLSLHQWGCWGCMVIFGLGNNLQILILAISNIM